MSHPNPLTVFDDARDALQEAGFKIRASDWLRELEDDDEPVAADKEPHV